jgi:heat shock protein HtpX
MDPRQLQRHKLRNIIQSVMLLGGMALLLMVVGWILAGSTGVWFAAVGAILLAGGQQVSPQVLFRMYQARRLTAADAPVLFQIVDTLAQRAELSVTPRLYYIPSAMMNAFTVGQLPNAAIGVTDGLLRRLTQRELLGVLAHEISHIVHRDTWVMGLADVVSRTTSLCATAGQILLIIAVPSMLLSSYHPPWLLILLLLIAPTLSSLLQLALSRTREFDADLEAARLTGDPDGLAAALAKFERYQHGFLERILMPGRHLPDPSLLRTHPTTAERIERLRTLAGEQLRPHHTPMPTASGFVPLAAQIPHVVRVPRWRPGGLWY